LRSLQTRTEGILGKVHDSSRSDYCVLNGKVDARLSDVERLTLIGGEGLDRLIARLGRSLESVSLDSFAPNLTLDTLLQSHERLLRMRSDGTAQQLLADVPRPIEPTITPIHGFPEGEVMDLHFSSPFPCMATSYDPAYAEVIENQALHVRYWEHHAKDASRQTIVAVHGWTMGDQRVNSLAFVPGLFFTLGCNVALIELPFHGRRLPVGVAEHTPLFPSADAVRTLLAMSHAIADLRMLANYLRSRGSVRIAAVGMSLGAYVAALWASLDALDRTLLLVPLASMGDMAWRLLKDTETRYHGRSAGVTKAFLRDLFNDHSPLSRAPATTPERIMVVGGKGDHLIPKEQIALLREQWPRATVLWSKGGHSAPAQRGSTFEKAKRFLLEKV
jgi:pimeloyl-ACP methyl ester carboxylesterase